MLDESAVWKNNWAVDEESVSGESAPSDVGVPRFGAHRQEVMVRVCHARQVHVHPRAIEVRQQPERCTFSVYAGGFQGRLESAVGSWSNQAPDNTVRHAYRCHG